MATQTSTSRRLVVHEGDSTPSRDADYVGQIFVDTTTPAVYVSTGTGSGVDDWLRLWDISTLKRGTSQIDAGAVKDEIWIDTSLLVNVGALIPIPAAISLTLTSFAPVPVVA